MTMSEGKADSSISRSGPFLPNTEVWTKLNGWIHCLISTQTQTPFNPSSRGSGCRKGNGMRVHRHAFSRAPSRASRRTGFMNCLPPLSVQWGPPPGTSPFITWSLASHRRVTHERVGSVLWGPCDCDGLPVISM